MLVAVGARVGVGVSGGGEGVQAIKSRRRTKSENSDLYLDMAALWLVSNPIVIRCGHYTVF